jgi:hypothetical protein
MKRASKAGRTVGRLLLLVAIGISLPAAYVCKPLQSAPESYLAALTRILAAYGLLLAFSLIPFLGLLTFPCLFGHTIYLLYAPHFFLYLLLAQNDAPISSLYIPLSPTRAVKVTYAALCWLHEAWRLNFLYLLLNWLYREMNMSIFRGGKHIVERDLVFWTDRDGGTYRCDVYRPPGTVVGRPIIVFLPGTGWMDLLPFGKKKVWLQVALRLRELLMQDGGCVVVVADLVSTFLPCS